MNQVLTKQLKRSKIVFSQESDKGIVFVYVLIKNCIGCYFQQLFRKVLKPNHTQLQKNKIDRLVN